MNCNKQLDGFFKHDGSRYGQVGDVICNHCGATISCVDHDNIVENLNTYTNNKEYIIDYYKLYKLDKDIWKVIKRQTSYNIFEKHKKETVTLRVVMEEICVQYDCNIAKIDMILTETDEMIKLLPTIIRRWISLLKYIKVID